jgi:hypothetical protein
VTEPYVMAVNDVDGVRVLSLTQVPPAGTTPAFAAAWASRQQANATGRCACGARLVMPNRAARRAARVRGEPAHATMLHEADCTASDDSLRELYRAGLN